MRKKLIIILILLLIITVLVYLLCPSLGSKRSVYPAMASDKVPEKESTYSISDLEKTDATIDDKEQDRDLGSGADSEKLEQIK